jgi:hypothetical protein
MTPCDAGTYPLYETGEEVFDRNYDEYGTVVDLECVEGQGWRYYLFLEDGDHVWAREENLDVA